jgi:hypothetical protein
MRSKCHKLREAVLILAGVLTPACAMAAEPLRSSSGSKAASLSAERWKGLD